MFTKTTCRAARVLLNWQQTDLARKASIGLSTVINFEKGHHETKPENIAAMQRALEMAGIEFTNGEGMGVRLVPKKTSRKR
jgi:transcriptional regulator with XRE-family HTH domain